ncbi:MAG: hypothetical protein ACE3JP_14360 [Ectobacillus sp.]
MHHYIVQFHCGQISFIRKFFQDYTDEKVTTKLQSVGRIQATFEVASSLSAKETERYLKDIFQKSKYGPALYYIAHVIEKV